jgi:preprotein translocase subunit SecF
MLRIVENRRWYFLLSTLIIIPGLIAMIYSMVTFGAPFKMGIDFTGGSLWELGFTRQVQPAEMRAVFVDNGFPETLVTTVGSGGTALEARLKQLSETDRTKVLAALKAKFGDVTDVQFLAVGPTIGREVTQAAALAIVAASLAILLFLVIAFRNAPHAVRFGVTAIVAMLHDLLLTMGIFSILSLVFGWEADALFLTAILTVIGFSVQDTIVVFDRVRENLPKYRGEPFAMVVDRSLTETVNRSLAIHLTALFVMAALLIFGGQTIKPFVAVLLVGVTTGTYSSIFNASPLLVAWEERSLLGSRTAKTQTQTQTA